MQPPAVDAGWSIGGPWPPVAYRRQQSGSLRCFAVHGQQGQHPAIIEPGRKQGQGLGRFGVDHAHFIDCTIDRIHVQAAQCCGQLLLQRSDALTFSVIGMQAFYPEAVQLQPAALLKLGYGLDLLADVG